MDNSAGFSLVYSGKVNEEVERIRAQYIPREKSKIERLRELDLEAQSAGMIESLSVGVVGILTFGIGMCMGLGVLPGGTLLAVILGLVGAVIMAAAYPLYRRILDKKRKELTPEILRLSEEIMNSSEPRD